MSLSCVWVQGVGLDLAVGRSLAVLHKEHVSDWSRYIVPRTEESVVHRCHIPKPEWPTRKRSSHRLKQQTFCGMYEIWEISKPRKATTKIWEVTLYDVINLVLINIRISCDTSVYLSIYPSPWQHRGCPDLNSEDAFGYKSMPQDTNIIEIPFHVFKFKKKVGISILKHVVIFQILKMKMSD